MALRRPYWIALLIVLMVGTAFAQATALDETLPANHADHCCPVCHVGHISVLQAVDGFSIAPLALLCWFEPAMRSAAFVEPQIVLDHSRGPPA